MQDTKPLVTHKTSFTSPPLLKRRHRLVLKNGECNIRQPISRKQRFDFLEFNKLVDSSWTFTTFIFLLTLLSSWLLFAAIWWLICYTHGDFEPAHLPQFQKQNNFTPCVYFVHNFASCFLFSIETQHTVGYGVKATTDECPEAIFVNAVQCIIGFIMQGIMAVVIFSKMTLPKLRSQTLLFSKQATISHQNNKKLIFSFRIGDMRKSHIIDANIRAFFVRSECTKENEIIQHNQRELKLQVDGCKTGLFFNWPLVVAHEINKESALYFLSPEDLLAEKFEVIVVLEGTVQSTGQMIQAKTSYVAQEIVWGYKFEALLSYNNERREYEADFSKFDSVEEVSTPLCSAACINEHNGIHGSGRMDFKSVAELAIAKCTESVVSIASSDNDSDFAERIR